MALTNQDFDVFSGDHKNVVVDLVDGSGIALDLNTISAMKWQFKKHPYSQTYLVQKTLAAGGIEKTNVAGRISIKLEPNDTKDYYGLYYHELELTDIDGNVTTAFTGVVNICIDGISN